MQAPADWPEPAAFRRLMHCRVLPTPTADTVRGSSAGGTLSLKLEWELLEASKWAKNVFRVSGRSDSLGVFAISLVAGGNGLNAPHHVPESSAIIPPLLFQFLPPDSSWCILLLQKIPTKVSGWMVIFLVTVASSMHLPMSPEKANACSSDTSLPSLVTASLKICQLVP